MPRILALPGTLRKDGVNERLARIAAHAAREAGAEVTTVHLRDYPMPLYDGDLEAAEGLPRGAAEFQAVLRSHDGLLIASGEYNASVPAALKNAIDWASRGDGAGFRGKTAALLSASPGGLGGMRALVHLRAILETLGVLVLPDQFALPRAHEAFAPDGSLVDPGHAKSVRHVAGRLSQVLSKLHA